MEKENQIPRQKMLEAERQRILAELQGLREAVRIEVDTDPEEGDPDLHERDKNLTLIAALERERTSIETALRAIQRGTYGTCERCDEPIPPERLEVRPGATHCVKCQAEVERLARRGIIQLGPESVTRRRPQATEDREEEM
ncbi:MAG: TraR/DksA C4-type zinc finger protein [Anaerolineales bacterium]|nr:TraR/DksA C4-type zinc finger protein [Anaerolineales bacterium]